MGCVDWASHCAMEHLKAWSSTLQLSSTGFCPVLLNIHWRAVNDSNRQVSHVVYQYSTVQYSSVQYSTVQYGTVQYSTVQYSTVQYSTVQYSTVQYSTVQYSTVQYSEWQPLTGFPYCLSVQYSTVQYSTVQYSEWQLLTGFPYCLSVQLEAGNQSAEWFGVNISGEHIFYHFRFNFLSNIGH